MLNVQRVVITRILKNKLRIFDTAKPSHSMKKLVYILISKVYNFVSDC